VDVLGSPCVHGPVPPVVVSARSSATESLCDRLCPLPSSLCPLPSGRRAEHERERETRRHRTGKTDGDGQQRTKERGEQKGTEGGTHGRAEQERKKEKKKKGPRFLSRKSLYNCCTNATVLA
jgi:hypothetical protein